MSTSPSILHPELLTRDDTDAIYRDGRRLDHAEANSKPLRAQPEPQPRGAKIHGNRPVDQAEAAARLVGTKPIAEANNEQPR